MCYRLKEYYRFKEYRFVCISLSPIKLCFPTVQILGLFLHYLNHLMNI